MKFRGHASSVICIECVYTPTEKAITADERGVIKLWNLDRSQGQYAECLQTLAFDANALDDSIISDFRAAFNNGMTVAILQQRLFTLTLDIVPEVKAIKNGLAISERLDRFWKVSNTSFTVARLSSGSVLRNVALFDPDNIDLRSGTSNTSSSNGSISSNGSSGGKEIQTKTGIFNNDTITSVCSDSSGKKIYIGTSNGVVLLYDGTSLGLLYDLTSDRKISNEERNRQVCVCVCY